jgi:hypothetical protein
VTDGELMIWQDDMIDNRAARVTTSALAGVLFCGDFSKLTLCFWGAGPRVEITEIASAANFKAGVATCRVIVGCDTVVRRVDAFHATTDIT